MYIKKTDLVNKYKMIKTRVTLKYAERKSFKLDATDVDLEERRRYGWKLAEELVLVVLETVTEVLVIYKPVNKKFE